MAFKISTWLALPVHRMTSSTLLGASVSLLLALSACGGGGDGDVAHDTPLSDNVMIHQESIDPGCDDENTVTNNVDSSDLAPDAVDKSLQKSTRCSNMLSKRESTGLAVQQGQFDVQLKGAWRVLGEGRLIEVRDDEIHQFQETRSLCYEDRQILPATALEGYRYRRVKAAGNVTLDLYAAPGAPSAYTLKALAAIPKPCRKAPRSDAATVLKAMWEIFDLDYGFFKERHINWDARYAALKSRVTRTTGDDELQAVLTEAIKDFKDEHVSLVRFKGEEPVFEFNAGDGPTAQLLRQAFLSQSEVASQQAFEAIWRQRIESSIEQRLSGGSEGRVLNGAMVWGRLPGNVGYIGLSRLTGFSDASNTVSDLQMIATEMDRAVAALGDARMMILDIAINDGGEDVIGAEVAGRFADRRRQAFTVHQHRPQGRKPQEWFVEPKGARQYLKPVYVLTTDRTISAGDTLALMMRALPNATQVGQPTSGSLSNLLMKSLPGNFMVSLSNERYVDPHGQVYEGRGVPPHVPLAVFDPRVPGSLLTGHEAAIDFVINRGDQLAPHVERGGTRGADEEAPSRLIKAR